MKLTAFIYHDVFAAAGQLSGFEGTDADWYKLTQSDFEAQIDEMIAESASPAERLAEEVEIIPREDRLILTFDDGGASALHPIADCLEARGVRGRFFIATGRLGTPGFLTGSQLRELHGRGHIIGTHSNTHRTPFAALPDREQLEEWRSSVAVLSDLLGHAITSGSVPGGAYDRGVARTAAAAGIELLFNSEPVRSTRLVDGVCVAGRYMLTQVTPRSELVALSRGDRLPSARRWLDWNARKVAKAAAGPLYARLRKHLLSRRMAK